jgi:hypothetical protein
VLRETSVWKWGGRTAFAAAVVACAPALALATPSTTYWAPSVATCQAKYVPHVTYDTYYGKQSTYPIDTGLTMGILPGDKVQAEIGYDALLPGDPSQVFLNGKVCLPENSLGKGVPAFSVGIYNVGFHGENPGPANNFNTLYVMGQKTLPFGGYFSAGAYFGLGPDSLYLSSTGEKHKVGGIFGWSSPDIVIGLTGLKKIDIIADVQTGKNVLGAGGAGLDIYFTDTIALIVGPVFYFDKALQTGVVTNPLSRGNSYFWTTQLDIDIPLGKAKP